MTLLAQVTGLDRAVQDAKLALRTDPKNGRDPLEANPSDDLAAPEEFHIHEGPLPSEDVPESAAPGPDLKNAEPAQEPGSKRDGFRGVEKPALERSPAS